MPVNSLLYCDTIQAMPDSSQYDRCVLCSRLCAVNRNTGNRSFCGETSALRLGFAGIHKGEEPSITGNGGSGTIFVSGCNLGCAFCQNYQISKEGMGREITAVEFVEICLVLQKKGAENINIVTGSHAAPALALGIAEAKKQGLAIPVVWNSSAYEGMEVLEILKDHVDVYLPDLKTLNPDISSRYFNAPEYPSQAATAIQKMIEYRELRYSGISLVSGVIIRHLVIPGFLDDTRQVLSWFAENCNYKALLSLMTQYTPVYSGNEKKSGGKIASGTPIPGTYLSEKEYDAVLLMLDEYGIDHGFCQELVTGSDWLPDFNRTNPFSSELSLAVWHWKKGFV